MGNKECRIYAACGVSQTPKNIYYSEEICLSVKVEMWDEVQFGTVTRRCIIKTHYIVLDFSEE